MAAPLAFAVLAGCAHEPAFRADLPASLGATPTTIAVIGDLQQTSLAARVVRHRENNADAQQRLIADLGQHADGLGALVIVGDLVFSARSARDWSHFDSLIAPFASRMPVLPAIGNHDYPCHFVELCSTKAIAPKMLARFPWFAPGRAYAVANGDLLMLFLDSETGIEAQSDWLAEQLDDAVGNYRVALVFFHRPPYTNSIDRGAEGNAEVEAHIVPRLRAAGLPVVVLNGHVHGLETLVRDGITYVTTAGGGGPRGPMPSGGPFDSYTGPVCMRSRDDATLRPFNYVLLRPGGAMLSIEIRGFCRGDAAVRTLQTLTIPD